MSLISLVIVLIVIGVLLWLVNSYIPMEPRIKQIINPIIPLTQVRPKGRFWGSKGTSNDQNDRPPVL